ncbi:hypothetical protein M430DRAFT_135010 [Amorphotheca resinae ATCC 22711]|uniref:NAD-dependent epimerase/dehydratase domain-containing protein n=1 Tax=Amorphotheca resinae ATCC 22711 TaxID=857342 RepID=A0A2T3B7E1_AMORE|nr:hypothetical protein M430DRAFT_135010 [Amorphotheca resinae ATCC 22711]PSS22762.1 hypothetical protein M430DRAFT_135010 [Amorphotheca resinae ATCC 22711]
MQLFITGATGYIGRVITEQAVAAGHTVRGLSRHDAGDALLRSLGATPVRGDLSTLAILQRESSRADAVLHLAYIHDWARDYSEILRIDGAAVDALASPLQGTQKPLVITSGTLAVEADAEGKETIEESPLAKNLVVDRAKSERHALSWKEKGVRVMAIRLPPYVYGRAGKGFLVLWMQTAVDAGEAVYIGDGAQRTAGVHVDDAAALFLLAAQGGKAGDVFNGNSSNNITAREMAEAVGDVVKVPVRSVSVDEAAAKLGPLLTMLAQTENRPSYRKAVEKLGWQPRGIDMLTDLRSGSYVEIAKKMQEGSTGAKSKVV